MKEIACGGRGKGKMMKLEEFLKLFPEDVRKDIIIVKASDKPLELRGNKLLRIVDYDMMETTELTWELWEEITSSLKNKRTTK